VVVKAKAQAEALAKIEASLESPNGREAAKFIMG